MLKKNVVITIDRLYGSGGRIMGQRLSEELGIPYYNEEILKMASEESAVGEQLFRLNDEKAGNNLFFRAIGGLKSSLDEPSLDDDIPSPENLFRFQSSVIRKLAASENCIIVGRCADYILEDIPNHLNVYVYAPDEARLKNCVENLQMDPQTAKKMMRDVDAARNRYHKAYIPGWQSVFDHKDLMIDSSRFGIDGTAKILADIVKNQWG